MYVRLKATALQSQAGIQATLHQTQGARYKSFWIVNALRVTSDRATLEELAARPDVERILPDRVYQLPPLLPAKQEPRVNSVEWNIAKINADDVWGQFSDTGQGIVIGSIDTGAQFDHPALVNQYRGNLGGGAFDHNYNWYDPARVCDPIGRTPCDNYGHGTHTMGTMVGDDGAGNQIGVAPGARWITAKGCESNWCSDSSLLAAGQWMLAPTDLSGENSQPDLRPQVVSNSWGGGVGNTWYQWVVQAWRASGIFPVFSIGNSGSACYSASSPGDYPESFGVGATDSNDTIAYFSSRGPSWDGRIKPDVSAPGYNIRSSVPGNGYDWYSGTSMAAPHVAGTVALLWSAAPALIGDLQQTADLLNNNTLNLIDTQCGGDPSGDPNNVYGNGRVDAFASVQAAPRIVGTLHGTVTDAEASLPLPMTFISPVRVDDGARFAATTDDNGEYQVTLPVDPAPGPETYNVTASLFGYLSQLVQVEIFQDQPTEQNFALDPAPLHSLSGTVRDDGGQPVAERVGHHSRYASLACRYRSKRLVQLAGGAGRDLQPPG